MYFYFPETRGCTIEEVAIIFDGPDSTRVIDVIKGEKEDQHFALGDSAPGESKEKGREKDLSTAREVAVLDEGQSRV